MRLPDDYEDSQHNLTPTIITTLVAVTLFVGVLLVAVLILNLPKRSPVSGAQMAETPETVSGSAGKTYPDTEDLVTGSTLSPDDLEFWKLYPQEKEEKASSSQEELPKETVEENDPSADGKHTLVTYPDGTEEWVLISPYLPKHEYDFTKLVCQSDIMKYYVEGRQASFVGADISKYQDYVDFTKVKKAGIDYVMLRVGARGYGTGQLVLDEYFTENIKRATDAGLDVGVYFFSQAISAEEAVEEANMVLQNLADYKITYPVGYDMEYVANDTSRIEVLSRSEKTSIAKAFLDTIGNAGYKTVLYGNKQWLVKEIDMSKLTDYDVWLSQQQDVPDYPYQFTMWQYSNTASVDGIAGYTNLNISFIDYSEK